MASTAIKSYHATMDSYATDQKTSVLPIDARKLGKVTAVTRPDDILDDFTLELNDSSPDAKSLTLAAGQLRTSDVPVAFPTETVYGLGADATRSDAVRGIYRAKQRPADNPLIVHFASLDQLRKILKSNTSNGDGSTAAGPNEASHIDERAATSDDPIPTIYHPLISRFWPGPLTLILPNPTNSALAPEVTANLSTFGARIPRHLLALALIKTANRPIAAPSANASTKPSPTAAEHVAWDLSGRIETILDGGPCDVGVESTVVDGLCDPPVILRPGGISLEQLRSCPGWENVRVGYMNVAESSKTGEGPRAPGMKYRHYSPKAPVVLFEAGKDMPSLSQLESRLGTNRRLGVITTKSWFVYSWRSSNGLNSRPSHQTVMNDRSKHADRSEAAEGTGFAGMLKSIDASVDARAALMKHHVQHGESSIELLEIALGADTAAVARGIFSALRELDRENVDAIIVEGIDDTEGDTAAAVMNRLRKAAEIKVAG